MAAPSDMSETYVGWQIVRKDEDTMRYDIAGMFIDRVIVDGVTEALHTAGFITVAMESKAVSLVRSLSVSEGAVKATGSYLLVRVDDAGIDVIVMRNGKFYFEYGSPWSEISDSKGEVSIPEVEAALRRNLRQVLNFYSQRWQGALDAIVIDAGGFYEKARALAGEISTSPVISIGDAGGFSENVKHVGEQAPQNQPFVSSFVAFGAGIRGRDIMGREDEINLLDAEATTMFQEERLLAFMRFWRVVVPVAACFALAIFGAGDFFLANTQAALVVAENSRSGASVDLGELQALTASSTVFNQQINLVKSAESESTSIGVFLTDVETAAGANNILVESISISSGPSSPITIAGISSSEDAIVAFKNALAALHGFSNINLPVTNIVSDSANGTFSFSMTLMYAGQ